MSSTPHLTAQLFYALHRPSACARRVRFVWQGQESAPEAELMQIIRERGQAHETAYYQTLSHVIDISAVAPAERLALTRHHLAEGEHILYQPYLQSEIETTHGRYPISGIPDFLVPTDQGWIVRDTKLIQRLEKREDILIQLNLYGFLLEKMLGEPPHSLEIILGNNEEATIPYHGQTWFLEKVESLLTLLQDTSAYEPVGWSKCGECGYRHLCWPDAEKRRDVALVPGVDQNLARTLHEQNCHTISDLNEQFDEVTLTNLKRPWGKSTQKVGKKARSILNHARVLEEQTPQIRKTAVALPHHPNLVMFDLEGLPSLEEGPQEIFIWGMKVFGERPSSFIAAYTLPGQQDDEATWFQFLTQASHLFDTYGDDLPFVHWASYEKTHIRAYLEKYGDQEGVGVKVLRNLYDLMKYYEKSVYLPLFSRSLKQVETYVGFKRTLVGFNGNQAIARYWRAQQTENRAQAQAIVDEILLYNEEDVDATWAAYEWLANL